MKLTDTSTKVTITMGGLHTRAVDPSSMSGSGGTPPKPPKAPIKKPGKKKK